jgi:vacuolar-type H+-ATPase subunit H
VKDWNSYWSKTDQSNLKQRNKERTTESSYSGTRKMFEARKGKLKDNASRITSQGLAGLAALCSKINETDSFKKWFSRKIFKYICF